MKSISVVADKKLRKFGINLAHIISKKEGFKAAYVLPEAIRDNELKYSGGNYAIFIGKNKISTPYFELIKLYVVENGVCWGYDSTKAAIYIKNSRIEADKLFKDLGKLKEYKKIKEKLSTGKFLSKKFINKVLPFPVWIYNLITTTVKFEKSKKDLQYKYGITKFLDECFDQYVK